MVEYSTVAAGLTALDIVTKTAAIEVLLAQVICPGKYLILFCGSMGAVGAALEAARSVLCLVDDFLLGRPHSDIFSALSTSISPALPEKTALGLVETQSCAAAVACADTAAKTAFVSLAEIRIAHGMCGKSTVLMTGEIAAVSAALENAKRHAQDKGMLLDTALIPSPNAQMLAALRQV